MRILVMGAGGVGSYYGALLARAGHAVTFVARGRQLAALRERGLEVRGDTQPLRLSPVEAVAAPAEAGEPAELVLFTVKTYDTEAAAATLRPAIRPPTVVLPLQNGVESVDHLGAVLGADRVLAGTTMVIAMLTEPGIVEWTPPYRRITLGEPAGGVTPRVEAIAATLREAGIEAIVTDDARRAMWEKFVLLAPHATISSACGLPIGAIRGTGEGQALYRQLFAEVVAVARAAGISLPAATVEQQLAVIQAVAPTAKTSMQVDYERRRRVELEQLAGAVVRHGDRFGVATPGFDALYAVLKVRAHAFGGLGS